MTSRRDEKPFGAAEKQNGAFRPHRRKTRLLWAALLSVVLAGLVLLVALSRSPDDGYIQQTALTGDLTTYYSFSGSVIAPERMVSVAEDPLTISQLYYREGDRVEKGEAVLKTSDGRVYRAGMDGELWGLTLSKGQTVPAGQTLFSVVDYQDLRIRIQVDEQDVAALSLDQPVRVSIHALGLTQDGRISRIAREASGQGGVPYFEVEVVLSQLPAGLLAGMSAEVKLENQSVTDGVLLPVKALQTDDQNRPYVYYVNEKGRMDAKYVTVGISDGIYAQIQQGVTPGETVYFPVEQPQSLNPMDLIREETE